MLFDQSVSGQNNLWCYNRNFPNISRVVEGVFDCQILVDKNHKRLVVIFLKSLKRQLIEILMQESLLLVSEKNEIDYPENSLLSAYSVFLAW